MSGKSVKLTLPPTIPSFGTVKSVRCASQRDYAIASILWDPKHKEHRLKVTFRSDSVKYLVEYIRRHPRYHYVFDLTNGGELIWENTSTEWMSAEQVIGAHHANRERK